MLDVDGFKTAVPFWGQTTWNLTGLPPKRDSSTKGVNLKNTLIPPDRYAFQTTYTNITPGREGRTKLLCAVVSTSFGSAHHGERRRRRTGAEPFRTFSPSPLAKHDCCAGETSRLDAVCWRVCSHERDHDGFVLRPSANHSCCICASSSGSCARRASHGNACHARHSDKTLRQPLCLRSRHSTSRLKPRHQQFQAPGSSVKICQLSWLEVSPSSLITPLLVTGQITKASNR